MTLNDLKQRWPLHGVISLNLVNLHVFQYITASICGEIYARVYCILYCVYDVVVGLKKFTFAISSPAEFLVYVAIRD